MGFFNRKDDNIQNSVNIKPQLNNNIYGLSLFGGKNAAWSDPYFWAVMQVVFNGLRNVQYTYVPEDRKLTDFLTNNMIYMIWLLWSYGYIVVGRDRKGNYFIPDYDKLEKDRNGAIKNYECVYYSDKYRFENKTDFQIVRGLLKELGTYKDAIHNTTNNLGAIGILSGGNLPVNPQEKQEFIDNLKSRYGINSDKNNILVTTMPLNFSVMRFPVKELELDEKVKECYTLLCNYFQVPVDMIFGNSTYANAEQALRNFYTNCISPLAEIILAVGKHLIKMDKAALIPTTKLSFRIDNVPEILDSVRIVDNEYVQQLLANIEKMENMGIDSTELKKTLKTYLSTI